MRSRQPAPQHHDDLSRRLALLGEELAWLRPDDADEPVPGSPRPGAAGERTDAGPHRPWWDEHTRVSGRGATEEASRPDGATGLPAPSAVGARSGSGPVRIPVPGRHAARVPASRPDLGHAADPRPVRARVLLGPAQLTVVTLVVVLALGVTCWWLARGRPDTTVALQAAPATGLTTAPGVTSKASVQAVDAVASSSPAADVHASASPATATSTAASTVTVDVSGKVRHPGIQVLPTGARVADALTAAGGARPGVDLTALNLAQVLSDGQQVLVGVATDAGASSVSGGSGGSGVASGSGAAGADPSTSSGGAVQVVDLNTATAEQLDSLPDVGPVTAQSILSWRQAHGGFTSVDELLEVDGIGEVTLGKLAPFVTV